MQVIRWYNQWFQIWSGPGAMWAAGSGCPVRPGNKVCGGYLRNPVELGRD